MLQALGQFARWLIRRLIRLYYPKIEVTGRELIPRHGPVLLVANHANSLIDPVMVGIAAARPVRYFAKAPLFDTPVLGRLMRALGMLPAYRSQDDNSLVRRNLESLGIAAQAMAAGDVVGIFPEGRSHDSLKLEQIRSGAARMAVQAVQAGARDLKILPVGINYQRKQLFRSAVWVRVGRPITVARFLGEHGDDRKAVRALTTEIEARLKRVVLHLAEPAFESFLEELELFLPPVRPRGHIAISALRQRKRLADAMNYFLVQDRPHAETMAQSIREYRTHLAAAGLSSHSAVIRFRTWRLFLVLAAEFVWLLFWFPAAVVGTLFHLMPFILVRGVSRRMEQGPTTTALARLGLGLPVYALWYVAAWWAWRSYFLPWVAWTATALMPLAGLLALTYAHRARDIWRDWLQQLRAVLRPSQLRALREEQRVLRHQLGGFAGAYVQTFPSLAELPRPCSWRERTRTTLRWAAIVGLAAGIFVWQNWYFKEHGQRAPMNGLNLAGLSVASLDDALRADETSLHDILSGVRTLETKARAMQAGYADGTRSWYRQADDDALRQLLLAYVNYRSALLRLIWKYQHHEIVAEEALRLRSFLVSYTAAIVLYETSLQFVSTFERSPDATRKLNEAEPLWEIPPGLFDTVRRNLANPDNRRLIRDAQAKYRRAQAGWSQHDLLERAPYEEFHAAITSGEKAMRQFAGTALTAGMATPLTDAQDTGKNAVYRVQTLIASWIGDTKVREPRGGKSLIAPAQVGELRSRLRPGDVMLERRNWFLSNAFLPGYWPHSALYVGTPADLHRLGLDRDPRVQKHWQSFVRRDEKEREHVIIEAISEGVVFTTLEHSVGEADSAAFLRPNLAEAQIKEAIARAFSHVGKPYDFEFDFFSTDKLVCSELVFRAYDGDIRFPLVDVMGRKTLPPVELVRQCVRENQAGTAQFSFVAFLEGDEGSGRARFANEAAFLGTAKRPAVTWLQPRR